MPLKTSEEFHDEEHLLGDDEKDDCHDSKTLKDVSRAKLLPYSTALNVVLLLALLSTWAISYRKFAQLRILNAVYCWRLRPK